MHPYFSPRINKQILLIVCLLCSMTAQAELVSDTETGKKTMSKFMINLAKFVTFPEDSFADASSPYKYCILGNPVMGDALDAAVAGKTVKNRAFSISRIATGGADDLKSCNVAFVSLPTTDEVADVVDALSGTPVLTVGEIENFAGYGGMIGFYGKGRKIALAINKKRLEAGGLKGSSKLFRASTM